MQRARCKFVCESASPQFEGATAQNIKLVAQYEQDNPTPEDERFSRYTPCGTFTMVVDNPALEGFFVPGRAYYIDLVPVE